MVKKSFRTTKTRQIQCNGFTLTESIIAMLAGTLLITVSGMALRTVSGLVSSSADKSNSRQNASNGLKLLRSEVERSMNILVFGKTPDHLPDTDLEKHTSINQNTMNPNDGVVTYCKNIAGNKNQVFRPVFGIKMVELANPIIYGLSTNSAKANGGDNYGYSLMRCGLPLDENGIYKTKTKGLDDDEVDVMPYISLILDNIGTIPCLKEDEECEPDLIVDATSEKERIKLKSEILSELDITFSILDDDTSLEPDAYTPYRKFQEPAIRFKTDASRKVLQFDDPAFSSKDYDSNNLIDMSYLNTKKSSQKIYMTAFARADKRLVRKNLDGLTLNGVYFNAKIDGTVRFVVDASGSMGTCMIMNNSNCKKTRMASVKTELVQILTDLKNIAPYTKVGITFFSHREGANHRQWRFDQKGNGSEDHLVAIGSEGALADAEQMIGSISPSGWTEPWDGLDAAFEDHETTTVFLLSDGEPKFNVSNQSSPESRRDTYPDLFGAWDQAGNQCKTRWWRNDIPNNYSTRRNKWYGKKCWTITTTNYNDWNRIAGFYANKNGDRTTNKKLRVHTVTIDLQSDWMEKISNETGGKYNEVIDESQE